MKSNRSKLLERIARAESEIEGTKKRIQSFTERLASQRGDLAALKAHLADDMMQAERDRRRGS
jgi:predicted  nucleic acid-binding Zn-ribbon protein